MRGWSYGILKKYKNAIKDYSTAIELDPMDEDIHFRRGMAYMSTGQNDEAYADFDESIELDPFGVMYSEVADVCSEFGEYEKAID